jgi:hypothetical protein
VYGWGCYGVRYGDVVGAMTNAERESAVMLEHFKAARGYANMLSWSAGALHVSRGELVARVEACLAGVIWC